MQCKVLTILLVVHQSGWGEVISSGYRASRRGWGTEGVSHRLRQSRSAASSLSTFVMPSKCVRACNVPTDRGKEGGGRDILALWLQESCMCMSMQLARSLASSRSNVWSQFKMSIRACSHEMRLLQQRYSSTPPCYPRLSSRCAHCESYRYCCYGCKWLASWFNSWPVRPALSIWPVGHSGTLALWTLLI